MELKLYYIETQKYPDGKLVEGYDIFIQPQHNGYVAVLNEYGKPTHAFTQMIEAHEATEEQYEEYYGEEN